VVGWFFFKRNRQNQSPNKKKQTAGVDDDTGPEVFKIAVVSAAAAVRF
jgi:hypothetical protein